jgi:hypothetical protein
MKKINYFLSTIFASLLLLASLQVIAQDPEITLIQPTEPGIEWTVGGEYLISWVDNFSGTVDIILVKGGADIVTVSKLLGHSDLKMTLRYSHVTDDALVAAVNKLAKRN